MKNLFMNAAKRHFSAQSLARKGAIIGAVGLSLTVGLSIVGGAGSVGKKIDGKLQDLKYLMGTMNNDFSGQIPTSADMSNFNSMQNYISNLGKKAADVSIDVARSAGPLAAFEARMGVKNDYVAMTPGQRKLFEFNGYGAAWKNSRYERAYNHFTSIGDKEGAEIAKRAWASTNSLNDSVGSKIGSWNIKGGGHGEIKIDSSAVEIGENGNIHLYGWDIYDFAATNKRASFLYGGLGPNSLKGTKFYKGLNKMPFEVDPERQIKINEKGFGEIVSKGTPGAKDIELGSLFETKMSGIGNTLNKNALEYAQEVGINGEKMIKPTTLWAATFNAEGKSLDNATLKSLSKLRAGKVVVRAMAGNFHYTFGAAAGLEAIGLMGVAAFAKRRKKRSTDAAGEALDKALDNTPDSPPTPANQEVGNALDTALENAPGAPPAPANQPIQSSLPENVIDELPPSAPPEPANTRMPNTQVDNIVQSSQPSPVRREGKVRDVEAIQRRQAEVDARRQTAEMVRQRREQVRNARNTSRGNAGGIPLPSQEERFSRFEDHFSRKRRRQQHEERMAAQKEQSIRRKEQQRAIKERQRNNIIDQQMSAQQEVRQRRTENRRFSPQQTLEERLENFKAGKRYRNTTLGTPYSNASQNLNRSTFSFDPLNPSVSINPRTTIDDITKRANTQRDIFNFSREKLQYDFNSPVKTDLPLRFNQTEMYERELPKDINLSRSSIFETKSANTQRDIFSFSREKLQYEFDSVKRSAQPLDFQTQPESPFKFNKNGMYKRQLPEEVTLSKDIDLPRSSIFGTERANPQRNPFSFSREKLQYGYSDPIKRQLQPSNFQTQPESPFKFNRTQMYPSVSPESMDSVQTSLAEINDARSRLNKVASEDYYLRKATGDELVDDLTAGALELNLPPKLGGDTAAHGIRKGPLTDQLKSLHKLLDDGISKDKPFYFGHLDRTAFGVEGIEKAYTTGAFVTVLNDAKDGFDMILVNPAVKHLIPDLEKAHPNFKFVEYGNAEAALANRTPPKPANPKINPVEEVVKKKTPKKPKPANTPTNNVTEATNSVSVPRLNLNGQQKQDARSTKARAKVEQEAKDAVENLRLKRQRPQLSPEERAAAKAARESTIRSRRSFKFSPPQAEIKPPTPANIPSSSPSPSRTPYRIDRSKPLTSFANANPNEVFGPRRAGGSGLSAAEIYLNGSRTDKGLIASETTRLTELAKTQGIDLSKLSSEDYFQFLLENNSKGIVHQPVSMYDTASHKYSPTDISSRFDFESGSRAYTSANTNNFLERHQRTINVNDPKQFKALAQPQKADMGRTHVLGEVFEEHQVIFKNYDTSQVDSFYDYLSSKGIKAKVSANVDLKRHGFQGHLAHLKVEGEDFEHSNRAKEALDEFFGSNIEEIRSRKNYGVMLDEHGKLVSYDETAFLESQFINAKGYHGDVNTYNYEVGRTHGIVGTHNSNYESARRLSIAADYYSDNNIFEGRTLDVEYAQAHRQVTPPKSQSQTRVQDVPYTPSAKTKERRARKEKTLAEKRRLLAERRRARAKAKQALKTPKNQPINDPTQAVNNASTPRPKVNDQQKDTKRNQDRKQNVHEEAQAVSNQGTQASQEAKNAQGNPDAIESKVIPAEEQAIIDAPKEAVKDVAEAAQKQKNAAAAAAATNPVEGKAAAEALKDATAELASKGKTALSHAGLAGAGAAGLFALYALNRDSRKEQVAPRRRHGRVHENPKGYDDGVRSTAVASAALGAVFGFGAIATNKLNPVSRGYLALGAAIGGGILASAANKNADSSSSILGMAGAGAAATLMYALVSKKGTAGLKALKSMLQRQGPKAAVDAAENAVRDIRKTFPMVQRLLSNEGLALGAGLVTLPAAHSIMVKHFANERRSQTDHGDVAFMPAWQDNKAGHTGFRRSNAPLLGLNNASAANVNFSGNVNTYYNSANVFERF
jgi:hypothetical protein